MKKVYLNKKVFFLVKNILNKAIKIKSLIKLLNKNFV